MLNSLQSGRAIAALMVVLFHLGVVILGSPDYWNVQDLGWLAVGRSGVNFFFVLSGFIIMWAHAQDIDRAGNLVTFVYKRLTRIYPVYWVVLALVVPLYFFMPTAGEGYETNPLNILTSFLLFPTSENPILAVAWTLRHEMLFYILFGLLIISARLGGAVMAAWLLGCVAALVWNPEFPYSFIFAPINLLFPMGIIGAIAIQRKRLVHPTAPLAAGSCTIALACALEIFDRTGLWLDLVYGLGYLLIIVGAVRLEQMGRFKTPSVMVELGNASYSIYLVHFTILSAGAIFWFKLRLDVVPWPLAFTALGVGSIVAGWLFHRIVERPLLSIFRGCAPGTKPRAATA